jgi:hypothetical protein
MDILDPPDARLEGQRVSTPETQGPSREACTLVLALSCGEVEGLSGPKCTPAPDSLGFLGSLAAEGPERALDLQKQRHYGEVCTLVRRQSCKRDDRHPKSSTQS